MMLHKRPTQLVKDMLIMLLLQIGIANKCLESHLELQYCLTRFTLLLQELLKNVH